MSDLIFGVPADTYWTRVAESARRHMIAHDARSTIDRAIARSGYDYAGETDPYYTDTPIPTRRRNRCRPWVRSLT